LKILLTGGAGYLGSVLTRRLLEKDHDVRVLDNFLFGRQSISGMRGRAPELVEGDIRDLTILGKSLKDVDAVIHLASIVGTQASEIDPKAAVEINYLATRNLADLCKLYGVKRLVFASTCSVYGAQPDRLITEGSDVDPLDSYGRSKFQSERAILQAYDSPTILRLGTLFGASYRMRFDLAVNLFLARAMNGERLVVFGGKQWRPFLHVADAADAFVFVTEHGMEGTYNIVWKNLTIMQMARDVAKEVQSAEIEVSSDIVDLRNYRVSGEKAEKLGIKPRRDIALAAYEFKAHIDADVGRYTDDRYSNYESFFNSKEIQRKIYTHGPLK